VRVDTQRAGVEGSLGILVQELELKMGVVFPSQLINLRATVIVVSIV
jgi:hypothetical protein